MAMSNPAETYENAAVIVLGNKTENFVKTRVNGREFVVPVVNMVDQIMGKTKTATVNQAAIAVLGACGYMVITAT